MEFITMPERVGMMKGFKQGLQKGESAMLIRLLQHRFHYIPSDYLELIYQADAETLLIWAESFIDAISLEEIFG